MQDELSVPFLPEKAFEISGKVRKGENVENDIVQIQNLYDEEILYVDAQIGRLAKALDDQEVIFAFTSDHGEEFWEQGAFEHGHHVGSLLTRIPLIVWGTGIEKRGKWRQLFLILTCFIHFWDSLRCPTTKYMGSYYQSKKLF